MSVAAILACPIVRCRPWPRYRLPQEIWSALSPEDVALHALWADTGEIYALLTDAHGQVLLASTPVPDHRYPALSPRFAAAPGMERMVHDLWGHVAEGAVDERPWLDHGHWPLTYPLAARPGPPGSAPEPVFRPVAGELMQLPAGPVFGHPAEPAHLRAYIDGDRVATLEARHGYAHKGTLRLMRGKSPRAAARFAARLSADATVAHAAAFARAVEAAMEIEAPPRAAVLRAVMAEAERVATHLGDLAAACAALPRLAGRLGLHREEMLRAAATAWRHRMMMDCVVPGGLAADLSAAGAAALLAAAAGVSAALPALTPMLDGLGEGIGVIPAAMLSAIAAAGLAGRAAGVAADARAQPCYPPYVAFTPAVLPGADVAARLRLRLMEVAASLTQMAAWLGDLPAGPVGQALPTTGGEGLAVAESPRGAVWHWLRLEGGLIAAAFAADPSWRLWPLQEAASIGARPADLVLIDRSFACARSGIDL